MIGAAKDKSSLPGSLTALRVLLCLLITFLLAGTRAEAFFAPPDQAPGQIAAFQPDSTGKTTTAWQYDALDSLIAAKEVTLSRKKYPDSVQHLEDTGQIGVEKDVVRKGTAARRKEATSKLETKPGFDRDESPPAFLRKDGEPASVRHVPSSDNRGAGASLGAQARGADKILIRVDED